VRLRVSAPAKLNLSLEVLGRRPDGFHELRTVFQAISLADRVEAQRAERLTLESPCPAAGPIEQNLALRALRLLAEVSGQRSGASLRLHKRIPVGAGLGGGSSDAAASLRLASALWGLEPPPPDLNALAARLGSDVPFFLGGPTALGCGRGGLLRPLPPLRGPWFVIAVPHWSAERKTPRVFGALTLDEFSDGRRVKRLADRLARGLPPRPADLGNGLEAAAGRVFPDLGRWKAQLEQRAGRRFTLSGAGPSLFHLASSEAAARECAARLASEAAQIILARPLGRRTRVRRLSAASGTPATCPRR
jgi:4-diphosphocytidyl-2-C-methyl-D-erythritol kinase